MTDSVLDPNAAAQRLIQRAHNIDGLPEIAVGLTLLCSSALAYLPVVLLRQSIAPKTAAIVISFLVLLCVAAPFGLPWALKSVRERYLIGRWGYVRYKPIGRKQIGTGIALAVLMAAVVLGVVSGFLPADGWILGWTGLFGGALTAWCGRLPRFFAGGVAMAAAGLLLAFSGVSLPAGFAILFGFLGLMWLVSGAVVFVRFIRRPIGAGER